MADDHQCNAHAGFTAPLSGTLSHGCRSARSPTPQARRSATAPISFTVAAVTGSSFDPNVTAKLTQAGQPDISASSISFTDSTFFEADFDDLSGIAPGTWRLEVANPGTASTIAPDTLTVIQCPS